MTMTSRTGDLGIELVLDHGGQGDHLHRALAQGLKRRLGGHIAIVVVSGLGKIADLLSEFFVHDGAFLIKKRGSHGGLETWVPPWPKRGSELL